MAMERPHPFVRLNSRPLVDVETPPHKTVAPVASPELDEPVLAALEAVRQQETFVAAAEERLASMSASIAAAEAPPAEDDPVRAELAACEAERNERLAELSRLRSGAVVTQSIAASRAMRMEAAANRDSFTSELQQAVDSLSRARLQPLTDASKALFPPDMPRTPGGGLGWGLLLGGSDMRQSRLSAHSSRLPNTHRSPGVHSPHSPRSPRTPADPSTSAAGLLSSRASTAYSAAHPEVGGAPSSACGSCLGSSSLQGSQLYGSAVFGSEMHSPSAAFAGGSSAFAGGSSALAGGGSAFAGGGSAFAGGGHCGSSPRPSSHSQAGSPRTPRTPGGRSILSPLGIEGPLTQDNYAAAQAALAARALALAAHRQNAQLKLKRVPKPSLLRRSPRIRSQPGVDLEWYSGPPVGGMSRGLFSRCPNLDTPLEDPDQADEGGRRPRTSRHAPPSPSASLDGGSSVGLRASAHGSATPRPLSPPTLSGFNSSASRDGKPLLARPSSVSAVSGSHGTTRRGASRGSPPSRGQGSREQPQTAPAADLPPLGLSAEMSASVASSAVGGVSRGR